MYVCYLSQRWTNISVLVSAVEWYQQNLMQELNIMHKIALIGGIKNHHHSYCIKVTWFNIMVLLKSTFNITCES